MDNTRQGILRNLSSTQSAMIASSQSPYVPSRLCALERASISRQCAVFEDVHLAAYGRNRPLHRPHAKSAAQEAHPVLDAGMQESKAGSHKPRLNKQATSVGVALIQSTSFVEEAASPGGREARPSCSCPNIPCMRLQLRRLSQHGSML